MGVSVPAPPHSGKNDGASASQNDGEHEKADKPSPLQLDLPGSPTGAVLPEPAREHSAGGGAVDSVRLVARIGAALLALVAVVAGVGMCLLPGYVRRECIEAAAEHGITLSVDEAKITSDGFRLVGVRLLAAAVPDFRLEAPQVDVVTRGLKPERLAAHGAELALRGPVGAVGAALAAWRASPSGGQAGAWAPSSIVFDGARVIWPGALGENVRVEAGDVAAQLVWHDRETDLHARSDRVAVLVPGGALGPWRLDVDRTSEGARVRVALDPGVPEACTVLIVGSGERTSSIDVVVPRSPLAHLGIPPQLLGLGHGALQLEAMVHYVALGPSRADASAAGAIHGLEVPWLPGALAVAWDGAATGNPFAGIEVKRARLAVGALVGGLTGTLKAFDDGFRLDLSWAAGPVPCASFTAASTAGLAGGPIRPLHEPAGRRPPGGVSASVMLTFDTRDPGATKLDFRPELDCRSAGPAR